MGESKNEVRWMLLFEDGSHVWVGRHSDPTEAEIIGAGESLDARGLAGWLAVVRGDYWKRSELEVLIVKRVSQRDADQSQALGFWRERRWKELEKGSES
jgi:hypothetical protein